MMTSPSPFLHRESPGSARWKLGQRKQTYAERIVPSPESQRAKIETYRYRWYARTGSLSRFMQRLGDWGREHFPFIGRGGWNGIGGNR